MEEHKRFVVSTQDLIRGMVKAGNSKKAREIGKEYLDRQELKEILSSSSKEIDLSSDLVQIVKYIDEVKQKIICKFGDKQLILYAPEKEILLAAIIDNNKHTFFVQPMRSDLSRILEEFYDLKAEQRDSITPYSIQIDSDFYDRIHTMTKEELDQFLKKEVDQLIEEEKAKPIKDFLKDFKANKQKTYPIIFTYNNHINFMEFFLLGKDCIWFVEHGNIRNNEVTISSTTSKLYFQLIEEHIRDFFTKYLTSKDNYMANKPFSFKRGVPLFVKSNILLIIFWALLFINKSSWAYDGAVFFVINILQSELLVLFLSFLACFRRESIKLKDLQKVSKLI